MDEDRLKKHRNAEKRERPDAFYEKLNDNCHNVVDHETLRNITNDKKKEIEKFIKKVDK